MAPRARLQVLLGVEWSTARRTVQEFTSGSWFIRGAVGDTFSYNTTTLRYFSFATPLDTPIASTEKMVMRAVRSFEITALAFLLASANGGGASATFAVNINGLTALGQEVTVGNSLAKAAGVVNIPITMGDLVCFECTDATGGPAALKAVGVTYIEAAGSEVA